MGLFSTVMHIYKRDQANIVAELSNELTRQYNLQKISRLNIDNSNYERVLEKDVASQNGIFYLITQPHGSWTTIIELNVSIEPSFYLYELANSLSKRLNTYVLSFHLHDGDVLLYNLEKKGESLDGYNSDYQYFLTEVADRNEILSQRHTPNYFLNILPIEKNISTLNSILNEGYWNAFDNCDLNEDGVPNDDKYFVDEQDRLERIGKYLGIFSANEYPFADWRDHLQKLDLNNCYLLKAMR